MELKQIATELKNMKSKLDEVQRSLNSIELIEKMKAIKPDKIEALDVLIRSKKAEQSEKPIGTTLISRQSLPKAIRENVEAFKGDWFSAKDMSMRLINIGVRGESEYNKIRPTVSTELRKLYQKGMFERDNVASEEKPIYVYKEK